MHTNVIRRDLILGRWTLILFMLMFSGYVAFGAYSTGRMGLITMFIVFSGFMAAFIPICLFAREDKFKAVATTCSLPVTRSAIIRARYTLSWILSVVFMAWFMVLGVMLPGSRVTAEHLLDVDTIGLSLTVMGALLACLLPFVLRFGLTGLILFLVVTQILGAISFMLAAFSGHRSFLDFLFRDLPSVIIGLRESAGAGRFYLQLLIVLVLLHGLSYMAALALFNRKEL